MMMMIICSDPHRRVENKGKSGTELLPITTCVTSDLD